MGWTELSNAGNPFSSPTLFEFGGELYADLKQADRVTSKYDKSTGVWSEVATAIGIDLWRYRVANVGGILYTGNSHQQDYPQDYEPNPLVFSSPDGLAWTEVAQVTPMPAIDGYNEASDWLVGFVGHNGALYAFVAPGVSGLYETYVYKSTDGAVNWAHVGSVMTSLYLNVNDYLRSAVSFGGKLRVYSNMYEPELSETPDLMVEYSSADGVTWTGTVIDLPTLEYPNIVNIMGRLYAFGGDNLDGDVNQKVYVSDNGTTWAYLGAAYDIPLTAGDDSGEFESAAVVGDRVYVYYDGTDDDEVWAFVPPGVPEEDPWYNRGCTPVGNEINRDLTIDKDFNRCLALDMKTGNVFPGLGFPFACVMGHASPCAGAGQMPGKMLVGGTDGYLYKAFVEEAAGLGTPMAKVAWKLQAATTTVLDIDWQDDDTFFPAGFLVGLPVAIWSDTEGVTETGVVASNTTTRIVLESALGAEPEAGSTILIAPQNCGVLFGEQRYLYPASLRSILPNAYSTQPGGQPMKLGVYTADDPENVIDLQEAAPVTQRFSLTQLQQGSGRVFIKNHASKALSYALAFSPTGAGFFHIGPIRVEESVHHNESTRSQ